MEKMRCFKNLFLVEGDYIDIACNDIFILNNLLDQLDLNRRITKSDLRFGDSSQIETNTNVETLPLTPKGKLAKYPQKLNFSTSDHGWNVQNDLFGSIFYLSDGSIGKAEIIVWNGDVCTDINAVATNGNLQLNIVYRTDPSGNKTRIFKATK